MNRTLFTSRCARLLVAASAGLLVAFVLFVALAPANPQRAWPSLDELLTKWKSTPITNIVELAEKGDASAQHYLGYCLVEGLRVPADPRAGVAWYEKALKNGYVPAANNLGLVYQRGLLGSNDIVKAMSYYLFAATQGLAQAQANIGYVYRDGIGGIEVDDTKAVTWFRRAAERGHAGAMVAVGRLYRCGCGASKSANEAVRWFQRAADLGQRDAMYELYWSYRNGTGTAADQTQATKWLVRSAEAGNPAAQCELGYHLEYPERQRGGSAKTPPVDLPGALKWYLLSAEQGWPNGEYYLGQMHLNGKAVELDEARGLELTRAAADQGHQEALHELADLYARGVGEPRGKNDQPLQLLQRAKAFPELIFRYEYALGTERNLVAAAQWYCRAAAAGSRNYSLDDKIEYASSREIHGTPVITPVDHHLQISGPWGSSEISDETRRVLSLYLKSAKGDGQAARQIAERFLAGRDVPESPSDAWAWLQYALQHGAPGAGGRISQAQARMSDDDLQTARQKLAELDRELETVIAALRNRGRVPQ